MNHGGHGRHGEREITGRFARNLGTERKNRPGWPGFQDDQDGGREIPRTVGATAEPPSPITARQEERKPMGRRKTRKDADKTKNTFMIASRGEGIEK